MNLNNSSGYQNQEVSIVTLNPESAHLIKGLQVSASQKTYIESAKECLRDYENNGYGIAWTLEGVYVAGEMVGFAMHGRQTFKILPYSQVWLDRFMIDERYQGRGYGGKVLQQLLPKIQQIYGCKKIYLSVKEDNIFAITLYKKFGFQKTIFKELKDERIMVRKK